MSLVIGTPCYGGLYSHEYVASMFRFLQYQGSERIEFLLVPGGGSITHLRNAIAARFLEMTGTERLLFVDADIGFRPEAVERLLSCGHDVAAGLYPLKLPHGYKPQYAARFPVGGFKADANGFGEVEAVGAGFLMISRNAFEQMMTAYPGLKTRPHPTIAGADKLLPYHFGFFDEMCDEQGYIMTEDYSFCARWRHLGGKIFVDSKSVITHTKTQVISLRPFQMFATEEIR